MLNANISAKPGLTLPESENVTTGGTLPPELSADHLRIGGLERWSSVDWPGQLAATLFCQGCSWACRYCHNQSLRPTRGPENFPWADVFAFLQTRKGLLDAVVFSGGEPLLQSALPAAVRQVKALGFKIGLHTGGPVPERFAAILPDLDWVGFDVKAPFAEYEATTGVPGSGDAARASLKLLLARGIAFDIRTTVHKKLLDAAALARLNADLATLGTGPTREQPFRKDGCMDADLL